ncbi:MAG: helix-turn-helix transcriptional regulator [Gemmatimonas sp.]
MAHPSTYSAPTATPPLGQLLQYWRKARNFSQLALAVEANVSSRHVSFMETGRTKPSRDMVLHIAETLSVPLRERNALLLAAGFAPVFRESSLDDPQLLPIRTALQAILNQQEPFPAVAMNRRWDIINGNTAAQKFFAKLLDGRTLDNREVPPNVLRLMFHPRGLRPAVINWPDVAQGLLQRLHREAVGGVLDASTQALLSEIPGSSRYVACARPQSSVAARSSGVFSARQYRVQLLLRRHRAGHAAGRHRSGIAHRIVLSQ